MDLRIMAVLAIILLVLAAACGPSGATVDAGIEIDRLVLQVDALENQVQQLQASVSDLESSTVAQESWASVEVCVAETMVYNPSVWKQGYARPVSEFSPAIIQAACDRVINVVNEIPSRIREVLQQAWNGRIEVR